MIWLSWRQFRLQGATVFAAVAGAVVVLALTGPQLSHRIGRSAAAFDLLTGADRFLFWTGIVVLAVLPSVLGAFWGAPLIARELEYGTQRLAWTQTITRTRWLGSRLGLVLASGAFLSGVLTWAVTWWAGAADSAVSATRGSLPGRLTPVSFAMRGVVPAATVVFAIALGVAVGAVLRRSLPAMAVTMALVVAAQIAVPVWLRPHLLPPVTQTAEITPNTIDSISVPPDGGRPAITVHTANRGDWILSNHTVDRDGRVVPAPAWMAGCGPGLVRGPVRATASAPGATGDRCLDRLLAAGYRQQVVYQPTGRFWPLQFAESALWLLAGALLTGASFVWLNRRLV